MRRTRDAVLLPALKNTSARARAFTDMVTSVSGGVGYDGRIAQALLLGLRWMHANPEATDDLLGRSHALWGIRAKYEQKITGYPDEETAREMAQQHARKLNRPVGVFCLRSAWVQMAVIEPERTTPVG